MNSHAPFLLMNPRLPAFTPPPGYARIQVVGSFEELVTTPFAGGVNALCWPRLVPGDFGEVVAQLGVGEGILTLDDARLRKLALSDAGRASVEVLLADQQRLREIEPRLKPGGKYEMATLELRVNDSISAARVRRLVRRALELAEEFGDATKLPAPQKRGARRP